MTVDLSTIDQNNIFQLTEVLKEASALYELGEPTGLTDEEYDGLFEKACKINPHISKIVGSPIQNGEKVVLPYPMYGMEQAQIGEVERFMQGTYFFGNCQPTPDNQYIAMMLDKLDGVSLLLHYQHGQLVGAFTRGDGFEGKNVLHHVIRMKDQVPTMIDNVEDNLFIRAEVIMRKDIFADVINVNGKYANPRNYVAGQMNRDVADESFVANVSVIPYNVFPFTDRKHVMIGWLEYMGFEEIYAESLFTQKNFDGVEAALAEQIKTRREISKYEIDGIVVVANDDPMRQFKYKIPSEDNSAITKVVDVVYNESKDSYLKPVVVFEPVNLCGVTISQATGFNGKFIVDNRIGVGAEIRIQRSGDTIPHIVEVTKPMIAKMPDCDWKLSEHGVDFIATSAGTDTLVAQGVHYFKHLGVDYAGPGNLWKVVEYTNCKTIQDLVTCDESVFMEAIGANGKKLFDSYMEKLPKATLEIIADASSCFGRLVGQTRLVMLTEAKVSFVDANVPEMIKVYGIGEKAAKAIVEGQEDFKKFIAALDKSFNLDITKKAETLLDDVDLKGTDFDGIVWQFTGVRDKELQEEFVSRGGKVGSKFTVLVAKDPHATSTKLNKAREKGVEIITLLEARRRVFGE